MLIVPVNALNAAALVRSIRRQHAARYAVLNAFGIKFSIVVLGMTLDSKTSAITVPHDDDGYVIPFHVFSGTGAMSSDEFETPHPVATAADYLSSEDSDSDGGELTRDDALKLMRRGAAGKRQKLVPAAGVAGAAAEEDDDAAVGAVNSADGGGAAAAKKM